MKRIIITESQYKRLLTNKKLNENIALDVVGDLAGDFVRDLTSAVPVAGDILVAAPSIIKNLNELKTGTSDLLDKIENQNPNEEVVRDMQSDIITDLVDLLQSILDVFPDPGATEVASFITSVGFNVGRILGGDEILSFIAKRDKFLKFIKKHEDHPLMQDIIPKDINPRNIVIDAFDALGKGSEYLETATDKMSLDQRITKKSGQLGKYLS
jgi:hypothetical protein